MTTEPTTGTPNTLLDPGMLDSRNETTARLRVGAPVFRSDRARDPAAAQPRPGHPPARCRYSHGTTLTDFIVDESRSPLVSAPARPTPDRRT